MYVTTILLGKVRLELVGGARVRLGLEDVNDGVVTIESAMYLKYSPYHLVTSS